MLELPLPPLRGAWGRIQREAAARHGAYLIPRRHFARILTPADATVDGLHLSETGHRRMAEMIWSYVGPRLPGEKS